VRSSVIPHNNARLSVGCLSVTFRGTSSLRATPSTRRGAIQLLGTAAVAGLAGCGALDTPPDPNERPPSSLGVSPQRATDNWLYPASDAGHTAHVVSSPPTTPGIDWHRAAATDGVATSKRRPIDWRTRSVLLNTAFLIDLMNGAADAVAKAQELKPNLVQQRLSAMTLFELYYSVASVAVDDQPWRAWRGHGAGRAND